MRRLLSLLVVLILTAGFCQLPVAAVEGLIAPSHRMLPRAHASQEDQPPVVRQPPLPGLPVSFLTVDPNEPMNRADFETPALDGGGRMAVSPYSTDDVTFSAETAERGVVVGVVENSGTSACIEPRDNNQKLGSGLGASEVGLSSFPIRATFTAALVAPAYVFSEFQTTTDEATIRLFDAQDRDVTALSVLATSQRSSCNPPGSVRYWVRVGATSSEPVAYAILSVNPPGQVFVIDNFTWFAGVIATP